MRDGLRTKKILCSVILAALVAGRAAAAGEPEIQVKVDRSRVYEGQSILYHVVLNHVDESVQPELLGFDDFDVTPVGHQPFNFHSTITINGRTQETVRQGAQYTYRLTPRKQGVLRIPGPIAKVNGQTLRGEPIALEVLPAGSQDVAFMEIKIDRPTVYPTQQATVMLAIMLKQLPSPYADQEPMGVRAGPPALTIPWMKDDDLPSGITPTAEWQQWMRSYLNQAGRGFSVNSLIDQSMFAILEQRALAFRPAPSKTTRRDKHGNPQPFLRYEFTRTFTATKSGTYTFGPVTLQGTFLVGTSEERKLAQEEVYAVAKPAVLTCKDVPTDGRPDSYIGVVGKVTASAELTPQQVKVGDPLTLTIKVTGQGTVSNAAPPDLGRVPSVAERFKVYEATQQAKGNTCRFTYALRPLAESEQVFPSIPVSYFDVDQEKFVTLQTNELPLRVTKAERLSSDQVVAVRTSQPTGKELETRREGIFANRADLAAFSDQSVQLDRWGMGVGSMIGLTVVAMMGTVAIRRQLNDASSLRRRAGPGRARSRVREAADDLAAGRVREAADHVQDAIIGLVADFADLPEASLTARDVCRYLETSGADPSLVDRVTRLLDACDAARYGAQASDVAGLDRHAEEILPLVLAALKARKRSR
jgi:hypothetical protein